MTLEVVCSAEWPTAFGHPASICRVLCFLMYSLLMPLFVFLAFESFLLAGVFIDAARIAAGKLVLLNHQSAGHAGLIRRCLGLRQ